ncbi:MAG: cytochrome c biogenesis protein, partial [Bacteroidales bacterium]
NKQLTVRLKELRIMNEMSLIIGLCLLTAGTFLGAIWANESWGRYWGWDPKEVWALVTMLVYAFVVHSRFIPKLYSNWAFNSQVLIAFASLLMTYFGVNYYLSGLHSYGSTESSNIIYMIYTGYLFIFILIGVSYKRQISK